MKKRVQAKKNFNRIFLWIAILLLISLVFTLIFKFNDEKIGLSPEETVSIIGTSEVSIAENFEQGSSETFYYIRTPDGTKYKLNFASGTEPDIISGETIQVSGTLSSTVSGGQEIQVQSLEIIDEGGVASGDNPTVGEQKTLVILVNFSSSEGITPISIQEAGQIIFGTGVNSVNSFYKEISYNKINFSGDVYGWYTLPTVISDCEISIRNSAIEAVDPFIDFNVQQYKRVIIYKVTGNMGCSGTQSTAGLIDIETDEGIKEMSVAQIEVDEGYSTIYLRDVTAHELGHGLGVRHANDFECGNKTIERNCENIDYGNTFDVMGAGYPAGHMNAIYKKNLGGFSDSNVLEVSQGGIYQIEPIETNTNGVKSLKIIGQDRNYSIEYKRPIGYDSAVYSTARQYELYLQNGLVFDGAMVNIFENSAPSLLDMSPQITDKTSPFLNQYIDSADSVLRPGDYFHYFPSHVAFRVESITDNYLTLFVEYPICGNGLLELSEQCDDHNTVDGDYCTGFCMNNVCGDGYLNPATEICDDGNNVDGDFCTGICRNNICGDGYLNPATEICDDGNNVDGDFCSGQCLVGSYFYTVFVTNETFGGDLDGLAGADNLCKQLADEAGLSPNFVWKAWLSNLTLSASQRLYHSPLAYKRMDGVIIANNWNDLIDATIQNPISKDQYSNNVYGPVWTGTNFNGATITVNPNGDHNDLCANWTSTAGMARTGSNDKVDVGWSRYGAYACSRTEPRLYCFQQPSCGNGNLEVGEQCDDWNNVNDDGCNSSCIIESICISQTELNNQIQQYYMGQITIGQMSSNITDYVTCN